MPRPPRKPMPITSFGAELQAVLRAGADKRIRIVFPTKNLAIRFKQRLHALRVAMKAADHPDWPQLYRCGVVDDPTNPNTVIVGPRDSEFRGVLSAAGIDVAAVPPITEVTIGESAPGSVDAFCLTSLVPPMCRKTSHRTPTNRRRPTMIRTSIRYNRLPRKNPVGGSKNTLTWPKNGAMFTTDTAPLCLEHRVVPPS